MTNVKDKFFEELNRHLAEKATEDQVIEQILALLAKVDQRRREHPRDRRRWDVRADDLEETLLESKRRQAFLEQRVIELTRKLEAYIASQDKEADTLNDTMVPELPDTMEAGTGSTPPEGRGNVQAAQRILDLPLFKLQDAPLEDFILAKLFLESKESITLSRENREDLTKRIKIYDRSVDRRQQADRSSESATERRRQLVLREALDKCLRNQVGSVTLDEINIIVACYDMLLQEEGHDHSPDDRLLVIVNDAIDKICATWTRMERLQRGVKP